MPKHRADIATKVRDNFFPIMKMFSDEMLVLREPEPFFSVETHHVNQGFEFTALKVLYVVRGRCYQQYLTSSKSFRISINFNFLVFVVI